MPIQYALFENHVTSDPDDYCAVVQVTFSADTDDIIDEYTRGRENSNIRNVEP